MKRLILGMGLLGMLFGGHAAVQAGVIYSQGQITSDTDILKVGPVLVANTQGTTAVSVTVNGVAFTPTSAFDPNNLGTPNSAGWTDGIGAFSNFPAGSPLKQLLDSTEFQFGGHATLHLFGLVPGQEYLLQILLQNDVNTTGQTSAVTIQGQTLNFTNFGSDAHYVRADFIATAATQDVIFGNGSSNEPDRTQLNAFALESVPAAAPVPEPGTLTMLGIGIACIAGYGWRRRRLAAA
jgi:PEP-CTERM motif